MPPVIRTIPALLASAVEDAGDRPWLRHEDEVHTFAAAAGRVAGAARVLHEHGAAPGAVVMLTARSTSAHLFAWLAVVSLGALLVPVDPALGATGIGGLVEQTRPHLVVVDDDLRDTLAEATAGHPPPGGMLALAALDADGAPGDLPRVTVRPEDPAVLIPTSGTTGRSKLVTQTHRAYVMAGEGFPHWMELTADDRLMTSLPLFHINAPAYSVFGSVAARAGLVLLRRFSASGFLDSARRHGATEFNAIGAMLEMLMRQPERPDDADTPLRLCYTGPSPPRERQLEIEARLRPSDRLRLRHLREPLRPHLAARHPPVRHPRQPPPAPRARRGEPGAGDRGRPSRRRRRGRRARAQQPHPDARLPRDAGGDRRGPRRRLAAHRRPGARQRRRHLHIRQPPQAGDPPPRREPRPRRGRGGARGACRGGRGGGGRRALGALRGGRQGLLVMPPGSRRPRALHAWVAARLARFKVPRYIELVEELPHTPTGRLAKHQLPDGRTAAEWDAEAAP